MMKIAVVAILLIFLAVLGNEIYLFSQKNSENQAEYQKVKAELDQTQADMEKTKADLNYYMNPANLEKELRARFNYRLIGEKMIIIVPAATSTSQ
ncbi:MAG TPA: hypothetical protein VMV71_03190 [Candidatus Paceibacterota bacterium]|nr:hypothetical protein [Candidatus Paceibacterota bacterium]